MSVLLLLRTCPGENAQRRYLYIRTLTSTTSTEHFLNLEVCDQQMWLGSPFKWSRVAWFQPGKVCYGTKALKNTSPSLEKNGHMSWSLHKSSLVLLRIMQLRCLALPRCTATRRWSKNFYPFWPTVNLWFCGLPAISSPAVLATTGRCRSLLYSMPLISSSCAIARDRKVRRYCGE